MSIANLFQQFINPQEAKLLLPALAGILETYEFHAYLIDATDGRYFVLVSSPDWQRYQEIVDIVESELRVKVNDWRVTIDRKKERGTDSLSAQLNANDFDNVTYDAHGALVWLLEVTLLGARASTQV